jgi:serine/threonine protein kinase
MRTMLGELPVLRSSFVYLYRIEHRFEEAHFEHDRIDAVAMERLTSSPHVINIFSFCGHSVMTEYADGNRLGELADKSKKSPLARLRIARDIASGLADVHGIDGDGNATFVHLDINPANVVSIGGTLKLNDFNIGIIRKWNTTSNQPCGFPAQYPNPQWRSPEEARNEQNLTEKVDVFSMGHIFFRLICGHEPWHKLEKGGKPTKQEMNEKVQKGILPKIPDLVKKSTSPEVVAIREAMLRCYEYDPSKRPSAREIAASLQKALDKLESQASSSK